MSKGDEYVAAGEPDINEWGNHNGSQKWIFNRGGTFVIFEENQ